MLLYIACVELASTPNVDVLASGLNEVQTIIQLPQPECAYNVLGELLVGGYYCRGVPISHL